MGRLRLLPVVIVALLASACGARQSRPAVFVESPSPSPSAAPSTVDSASPTPTAAPSVTFAASRIVYANRFWDDVPKTQQDDLWLYDVGANTVRRLTSDAGSTLEFDPRFRQPDTVTFIADPQRSGATIVDLDLSTGKRTQIVRDASPIISFSWKPGGTALAYLTDPGRLVIFRLADRKTLTVPLPPPQEGYGRGGGDDDEVSVWWSPGADAILVVNTARCCPADDPGSTIYVVRLDGSLIVPAQRGTFARWSANGRTVFFRGLYEETAPWVALDVATGSLRTLPTVSGAMHPAVSPDGRYLAYDDGRPTPSVYVFDIAAGTERTIGPGLGPLWLESELLAVTEARPCRDDEVCGDHAGPRWRGTGHVSAVSLPDGSGRALSLTSTIDADVLYA